MQQKKQALFPFQSSSAIAEGRYLGLLLVLATVLMFQSSPLIAEGRYQTTNDTQWWLDVFQSSPSSLRGATKAQ